MKRVALSERDIRFLADLHSLPPVYKDVIRAMVRSRARKHAHKFAQAAPLPLRKSSLVE
jgi:hypothetical protein